MDDMNLKLVEFLKKQDFKYARKYDDMIGLLKEIQDMGFIVTDEDFYKHSSIASLLEMYQTDTLEDRKAELKDKDHKKLHVDAFICEFKENETEDFFIEQHKRKVCSLSFVIVLFDDLKGDGIEDIKWEPIFSSIWEYTKFTIERHAILEEYLLYNNKKIEI